MRVIHVITVLDEPAGASVMLSRLLSNPTNGVTHSGVITLSSYGSMGKKIESLGVPVRSLNMKPGLPDPSAPFRLARWLKNDNAQVVQTWTYHADLIGGLAAKIAGIPSSWGIHHTDFNPKTDKRSIIWIASVCARLSGWLPSRIICCSESCRAVHTKLGYASARMTVIPNGFDTDELQPDPNARSAVRMELGLYPEAPLIGLVARYHPQKDHRNFIQAALELHSDLPNVQFLLCGEGVAWTNSELSTMIDRVGLRNNIHLLGSRTDIPRLQAALDVATLSSSHGEAFPLAIGEAMACGVPCVVTDVGDSAHMVGATGVIVPTSSPSALAEGWRHLLVDNNRRQRMELGLQARKRIVEKYRIGEIAERYGQVFQSVEKPTKAVSSSLRNTL